MQQSWRAFYVFCLERLALRPIEQTGAASQFRVGTKYFGKVLGKITLILPAAAARNALHGWSQRSWPGKSARRFSID